MIIGYGMLLSTLEYIRTTILKGFVLISLILHKSKIKQLCVLTQSINI